MQENNSLPEFYSKLINRRGMDDGSVEKLILLKLADLSVDRQYSKKLRSRQTRNQDVAKKGIIQELTNYVKEVSEFYTVKRVGEDISLLIEEGDFKFPFARVIEEGKPTDISSAVNKSIRLYDRLLENEDVRGKSPEKLYDSLVTKLEETIY